MNKANQVCHEVYQFYRDFIATIKTQMFYCFKLYVKCILQDLFELIERQVKRFRLSLAV